MFQPILDPFHRPAEAQACDADQEILGVELAADAEAATDMALVELHRGGRPVEKACQGVTVAMRYFRGAP